jgi:hypothetical protein
MVRWLNSLQKHETHEAAKNLMVAWSLICAFALIVGLSRTADTDNVMLRALGKVLTIDFWSMVWAYPTAGLGIIAFVTWPRRPRQTLAK